MNPQPRPTVFLQKASYRQRRLRDAARLLPFVGVVLWLLPLSWGEEANGDGANRLIYIFVVWVLLIIGTAALANTIRADRPDDEA